MFAIVFINSIVLLCIKINTFFQVNCSLTSDSLRCCNLRGHFQQSHEQDWAHPAWRRTPQLRRVDVLTVAEPLTPPPTPPNANQTTGLEKVLSQSASDSKHRVVFLSARVHPGEAPSSFVLQGLLEFLTSGCPTAGVLRREVTWVLVSTRWIEQEIHALPLHFRKATAAKHQYKTDLSKFSIIDQFRELQHLSKEIQRFTNPILKPMGNFKCCRLGNFQCFKHWFICILRHLDLQQRK